MKSHAKRHGQAGFSLIELTVTMGVMVAVMGVTAGLMADALRTSTITSETTEAQQQVRASHEYINRDLLVAGDGLGSIGSSKIRLPTNFVDGAITSNANDVRVLARGGVNTPYAALPLVTADDAQTRTGAAPGLLAGTDRLTLMTNLPDVGFPVSVPSGVGSYTRPDANTLIFNVPGATSALFRSGEVVLVSSTASGSTVSTLAAVTAVGAGQIRFAGGDPYGLNTPNLPLLTDVVCGAGTPGSAACNSVTVQRVLLITYFVDQNGLLRRRVLGKPRRGAISDAAFAAAAMAGDVVAEHIEEFEVRYGLIAADRTGWEIVDRMTADQEPRVRQVEIMLTAETPHAVLKGGRHAEATSVVRTSVRTMEYRNAL
ncbi:MAG TPA: hypothetical protein VIP46_14945 [Pyrinomonadaceae bacterium]